MLKSKEFLLIVFVLFLFLIVSYLFFGYFRLGDDTYIYLQYAKHMLYNREISFNLGYKSYGFTSPLWLGFIVLFSYFTKLSIVIPELLSLSFAIMNIVCWAKILKQFDLEKTIYFLFLLLIAFDPNLLKHTYLGMEATLSYFLTSLLILFLLTKNTRAKYISIGIILGVYQLVRPESAIIGVILFIWFLFYEKISYTYLILMILSAFIITLPWFLFSLWYFNQLLPNTFYVKGGAYPLAGNFVKNVFDTLKIFGGSYLFLIVSLLWFLKIFNGVASKLKNGLAILSLIIIFCIILFYSLTISNEYVYSRYYCVVFPFLFFAFLVLFQKTKEKMNTKIFILSIIIISHLFFSFFYRSKASSLHNKNENLENQVIAWVNKNTDKNDKIMRGRIGKIGFLTDREIIDPVGIINPEISEYYLNTNIFDYYKKVKPDYIISYEMPFNEIMNYSVVNKFVSPSAFLVRQLLLSNGNTIDTLKVYKLNW